MQVRWIYADIDGLLNNGRVCRQADDIDVAVAGQMDAGYVALQTARFRPGRLDDFSKGEIAGGTSG